MYLFDELINKNSLKPYINYNMMEKQNIMLCKHKITFYFTKFNNNLMFYNTAGTYEGNQMYWNSETVLCNLNEMNNSKVPNRKTVLHGKDTISHNFTPIMNDPNGKGKYYAVGGCGKKGELAREPNHHYKKGIYLLESNDLYKWKIVDLIIHGDKYKGWNPVNRESIFDSNIDCFYSKILKKYLLFTRYNYAVGSRTMQLITSSDYYNWDEGKMVNIDSYKRYDNYYMYKIMEIPSLKLFLMVSPFSVLRPPLDVIHRGKVKLEEMDFIYGFKLLLSRDAINWKDCGLMAHIPPAMKHDATPVMQPTSFRMVGKYDIELEFHDLYFTKQQSTIYRSIIDLRKFIGVKITDTTIFNKKIRLDSSTIKINYEKLSKMEECKQEDLSEFKIKLSKPKPEPTLDPKLETKPKTNFIDIYENEKETLSYQRMTDKYPTMISAYSHSFQEEKTIAPARDEILNKFNNYKNEMELKCKEFENELQLLKSIKKKEEVILKQSIFLESTNSIPKSSSYVYLYINGKKCVMNKNGIINIPNEIPKKQDYEVTFRVRNIILYSIE